jgi:hypothetical protein
MPTPDHERAFLDALQNVGVRPKILPSADADTTQLVEGGSADRPVHTTEATAPPATVTAQNLWRHPDAHPIVLDLLVLRQYGPAWLGWESETLSLLIPQDFNTPTLSDLNLAKLQACKTLHLVDSFWERWEVFTPCAMAFNSEFPDFEMMQVPTLAQCLVAADVASRIRIDSGWSTEMKAYFKTVYQHDGIFFPLPPLGFITLEHPDGVDEKEIARRWAEVRASGQAPLGATPIDEQLRRLLTVHGFLEESRARLQQQLRLHA